MEKKQNSSSVQMALLIPFDPCPSLFPSASSPPPRTQAFDPHVPPSEQACRSLFALDQQIAPGPTDRLHFELDGHDGSCNDTLGVAGRSGHARDIDCARDHRRRGFFFAYSFCPVVSPSSCFPSGSTRAWVVLEQAFRKVQWQRRLWRTLYVLWITWYRFAAARVKLSFSPTLS